MIPQEILDEIAAHAGDSFPQEACGFIVQRSGTFSVIPVPNAAEDAEREFVMEPQSQIDAMRNVSSSGSVLFGTYHSHPTTPPVPSDRDMRLALYPDLIHVIVSLGGVKPEFGSWSITPEGCREVGDEHDLRENQHMG